MTSTTACGAVVGAGCVTERGECADYRPGRSAVPRQVRSSCVAASTGIILSYGLDEQPQVSAGFRGPGTDPGASCLPTRGHFRPLRWLGSLSAMPGTGCASRCAANST